MGSQLNHNATLTTLAEICRARDVSLGDLLELIDDPPKPGGKRARKRR